MKRCFLAWVLFLSGTLVQADTVHIAAAANLRYVLPELIDHYSITDTKINVTYAASGTLSHQIRHGAPYQMFLSANAAFISPLIKAGVSKGKAFDYADGQMALFAGHHSPVHLDEDLQGLKDYLSSATTGKIAIANPQHAPYGIAARDYLQDKNLWQAVEPFLLQAENASQLTQFSLTGNAVLGFIPYSHAIHPQVRDKGRSLKLPVRLKQQGILTQQATPAALAFAEYLQNKAAQSIFIDYGFLPPEAD